MQVVTKRTSKLSHAADYYIWAITNPRTGTAALSDTIFPLYLIAGRTSIHPQQDEHRQEHLL